MKDKNISDTIKLILLILMIGTLSGQILSTSPTQLSGNSKRQISDNILTSKSNTSLSAQSIQISNKGHVFRSKTEKYFGTSSTNPNEFISTWMTDVISSGSSNSNQIKLPLVSTGTYNFTVDWGDGTGNETITSYSSGIFPHTYFGTGGTYTIIITGVIRGWEFNESGDALKIFQISQWGPLNLGNTGNYFYGAENLQINATDALNLTGTTNMYRAFASCRALGAFGIGNFDGLNTSAVTNMSNMFTGDYYFNLPIGEWDVSRVTDMSNMFTNATFNQSLAYWNVSSVTNMSGMFSRSPFNRSIANWNVSKVTDMSDMFFYDLSFNRPLGNWNVSRVSNMGAILDATSLSVQNYNNLLLGWSKLQLQNGVLLDVGTTQYSSSAASARQKIITVYNWTISDGGEYGVTNSSTSISSSASNSPISSFSLSPKSVTTSTGVSYIPTIIAISLLAILMIERRKR